MAGIEGHDNSTSGVLEAIQDMASAIRKNNNSQQEDAGGRFMRIQGEFCKCQPPIFKGVPDPMAAEEWIRQIKRKLKNQRVPEELKVEIACTYLEEQAYHWWESVLRMPDTEITTWDAFENIFLEKYFPSTVKGMKAREFVNLVQGELSIADYQAKFEELMRFAPNMILDEYTKAKRFEDGLKPMIREKVAILKLNRYADVVERALIAEQSVLESMKTLDFKTQRLERTAQDPRVCFQCGKFGHIQKNCPLLQIRAPQHHTYAPYLPQQNYQRPQYGQHPRYQGGVPTQARPNGPTSGRQPAQLAQDRVYCLGQVNN
ncbi:uncharacterized protein LOC133730194 [Rosa rugosa]|uniref:uncharacterized protein LOC133730194 n=1 Tax=Rosa rugosa TaxID=74645 RepID=UPI002B411CAB|nr:uncharacterized protein LOC133730194 [Rosa rugosa]